MTLDLVLIILIARYLRTSLKAQQEYSKWDKILLGLITVAVVALVADVALSSLHRVIEWLAIGIQVFFVYILSSKPEFRPSRPVLIAITPYILASLFSSLLQLISKSLYEDWEDLLGTIILFATVWGFGSWWMTIRQKKALDKERFKTKEEEEHNRMITAMKEQLEIQVAERTVELTRQKEELQSTVDELKNTQAQLIQAEKMASLGELTAGIAHEIQNPLNFVNNFSEVNAELIDELRQELESGNTEEALLIAGDIKDNEQKISHHGKRADGIVKGMLQHSRKNTGQKELTDMNVLCDEYLRLSYHGLRAKDKTFNAKMQTSLDAQIDKLNIVPQDVGRVLLNLFNNAFYAVTEKKKTAGEQYHPEVSVSTKKTGDTVEIKVADNGNGVPQQIADKIFQPFFTTKPTGQGTGLGLSLSYDIIQAHNGELTLETEEGKGTAFIISLPL